MPADAVSCAGAFFTADPGLPVLYSFRRCPYAMRARLALVVSGQRCELREISLSSKPPELLAASPKGTVPVLVLPQGEVIDESLQIMHWALLQHDPEGWLKVLQGAQDATQTLISANDGPFKYHLDRYKYPNRYMHDNADAERSFAQAHRASAACLLTELDCLLGRSRWLFGPGASLADMAILPFVRQFAQTDPAWFDQQAWPGLQRWLADWLDSELYERTMKKYPRWTSGALSAVFP